MAPPPEHWHDIVVIANKDKTKMMVYDQVPFEERELKTAAYNEADQKNNWWWIESTDGYIVIHAYNAPDMVWA